MCSSNQVAARFMSNAAAHQWDVLASLLKSSHDIRLYTVNVSNKPATGMISTTNPQHKNVHLPEDVWLKKKKYLHQGVRLSLCKRLRMTCANILLKLKKLNSTSQTSHTIKENNNKPITSKESMYPYWMVAVSHYSSNVNMVAAVKAHCFNELKTKPLISGNLPPPF